MMSINETQKYIISRNEQLQEENKKLLEEKKEYEEELESCGNDQKTINNLRSLLHNLNSIGTHRNEMLQYYENQRNITTDYIRDFKLSQNLHFFAFFTFLFISIFVNSVFFYAVFFLSILEIWINSIGIGKFQKEIQKISSNIFEKQTICNKELKNMEIFDQLIDSV